MNKTGAKLPAARYGPAVARKTTSYVDLLASERDTAQSRGFRTPAEAFGDELMKRNSHEVPGHLKPVHSEWKPHPQSFDLLFRLDF